MSPATDLKRNTRHLCLLLRQRDNNATSQRKTPVRGRSRRREGPCADPIGAPYARGSRAEGRIRPPPPQWAGVRGPSVGFLRRTGRALSQLRRALRSAYPWPQRATWRRNNQTAVRPRARGGSGMRPSGLGPSRSSPLRAGAPRAPWTMRTRLPIQTGRTRPRRQPPLPQQGPRPPPLRRPAPLPPSLRPRSRRPPRPCKRQPWLRRPPRRRLPQPHQPNPRRPRPARPYRLNPRRRGHPLRQRQLQRQRQRQRPWQIGP